MAEPTQDERILQLKKELDELKAQAAVDSARQTRDAAAMKAMADALKDQTTSQVALGSAQAQLPFSELHGIKAGISGLTLPAGKEGTVKVSAGAAGTALLRSKRPMLRLLDKVATELIKLCSGGAALLTDERLAQANTAQFTLRRISDQATRLAQGIMFVQADLQKMSEDKAAEPVRTRGLETPPDRALAPGLPAAIAGTYTLGFTLDTINSLAKLMRTNRQLDVFGTDPEASQLLGYLLESKSKTFNANPAIFDDNAMAIADSLMEKLGELGEAIIRGSALLNRIKTLSDAITRDHPNDPAWTARMPAEVNLGLLKAGIDSATALLDGLHPTKKPDAFWAQVSGQQIAENIQDKLRLFLDVKAQTVQVTESRWYASDRILATGEVQVAYRLLKPDGSHEHSGVILKVSGTDDSQIDRLRPFEWPRE